MAFVSRISRRGGAFRFAFGAVTVGAITAGAGVTLAPYVDIARLTQSAPTPVIRAGSPPALSRLFDPAATPGAATGFSGPSQSAAPTIRQADAFAPAIGQAPLPAAAAPAPVRQAALPAKPHVLPAEPVAEAAIPAPPERPQELALAPFEAETFVPTPPRRPADLAPPAPAPRVEARRDRAEPPARRAALPAPAPAPMAAPSTADPLERFPAASRQAQAAPETPAPRARLTRKARNAAARTTVARAPAQGPSFFERLFGGASQPGPALAYAPVDRLTGDIARPAGPPPLASARRRVASLGPTLDETPAAPASVAPRRTGGGGRAIYDIAGQVVILPDGTRLEAHSGLGEHRDKVASAHIRMRGVTPPHTYKLTEREALFHGVRAIRLTPVGGSGAIHGRAGLLAHTYMLGPNGDSNGCISIRNYAAFLQAFLDGRISELVVVPGTGGGSLFASR